ncbi:SRPBCC family protein [Flavobacterium sp. CBA20B-1]|uniref:SRPBCC family protein n=1 Tax=unclassified Flavobacterium TaxID=196869 RepID=UPI0022244EFE|nr:MULTISPECIES: SRPBCC family protein [unclassified Flavobacterium]WCM43260.1 SRPBCC family protein [Flavobacterium sp. CBA20B-1]
MKFLKYTLLTLLGLVALALIAAAILPKTFHAEGSAVINKPNAEVFNYVKHIKNQENFGVWFELDPNIIATSEGTDGTEGFKYSWKSEEVGNGSQVITKINENSRVDIDLFLMDSTEPAKSYFTTEAVSDTQTKVRWVVDGEMPYPFNLMSLFYDMNKDFEKGTANLKTVLEKQ